MNTLAYCTRRLVPRLAAGLIAVAGLAALEASPTFATANTAHVVADLGPQSGVQAIDVSLKVPVGGQATALFSGRLTGALSRSVDSSGAQHFEGVASGVLRAGSSTANASSWLEITVPATGTLAAYTIDIDVSRGGTTTSYTAGGDDDVLPGGGGYGMLLFDTTSSMNT